MHPGRAADANARTLDNRPAHNRRLVVRLTRDDRQLAFDNSAMPDHPAGLQRENGRRILERGYRRWRIMQLGLTAHEPPHPQLYRPLWHKAGSFRPRQHLLEERCRMQVIAVGAECDRWRVNK